MQYEKASELDSQIFMFPLCKGIPQRKHEFVWPLPTAQFDRIFMSLVITHYLFIRESDS
ncbi:hypothetical protein HanPSC8_Chr11g0499641 [Helianthus annuus]|nr:hypothetical protein HanPSC8_Chr11g0499641 [Helianthus annuus]